MAKPALGTKRICQGCEAKFYDLNKDPIVCPSCETVYVIAKPAPPRGGRAYAPRSSYDPRAQAEIPMGTLQEAPGVAGEAEEVDEKEDATDDAEVAEIEEAEDGDDASAAGGVPMLEELDEK